MTLQSTTAPTGLKKYVPILDWLPGYSSRHLPQDLVAGLTTAAVVIPQSMAYAGIAGLPVQVGLYTALVPMLVYAILGRSRVLSVSVTSTISMLTATELARVVQGRASSDYLVAASTLALLVGGFLVLAGLLRLGFIANFISLPVLTGFKAGIGLVIIVGQLGKVLGIPVAKGPFFETILLVVSDLGSTHLPTLLVALGTVLVLLLLPRLAPRVSAPLVAVAVAILASAVLGLADSGVKLVGEIPSGLPEPRLPNISLFAQLWPGALGIALMSFVESIAAAKSYEQRDDPPIDASQEMFALGAANVVGGFFQAYPGGGGASQTAVNARAGARTQLAAVFTALVVALALLFLGPIIGLMPQATLGALVLVSAAGLVNIGEFRAIGQVRAEELTWAIIAAASVVVLGTLEGILVGVIVSTGTLLYHANHPPVYAVGRKPGTDVFRPISAGHPEDEVFPGLLMIRIEGRLYYASVPQTRETILNLIRTHQPRVVVLDCSAVLGIEYTALQRITLFESLLREQGIELWLADLNPGPLRLVEKAPLGATLGHERMFFNLEQAVEAYLSSDE